MCRLVDVVFRSVKLCVRLDIQNPRQTSKLLKEMFLPCLAPQHQTGKAGYPPGFRPRLRPPPTRLNRSNRRLEPNDSWPFQADCYEAAARRMKAPASVGAAASCDDLRPRQERGQCFMEG